MTWNLQFSGNDDLSGDEKKACEENIVELAETLLARLKNTNGVQIIGAVVNTNTTGQLNLLEG